MLRLRNFELEELHSQTQTVAYESIDTSYAGLSRWHSDKEPTCQCRRHRRPSFGPQVRKIPWRKEQQPAPEFLSGKSHGERGLVGYSPSIRKRVRHS